MGKTLKFTIDIMVDGKSQLATVALDAKEVGKALGRVNKEAQGLAGTISKFSDLSVLAANMQTAFSSIAAECKVLTDAYQLQLESETKLETVMRQRMAATDRDIQAMKELASPRPAQRQIAFRVAFRCCLLQVFED